MKTKNTLNQLLASFDDNLRHYVIANHVATNTWGLIADIQAVCHGQHTAYAMLYQKTKLADLSAISPYVALIKPDDALATLYENNAITKKNWSGIIVSIDKDTPFETLLQHLRDRLFVSFSDNKKGILHFSNPAIAHYLFGENTETTDTETWLGPIKHISWYGPTTSPNDKDWCAFSNSAEEHNDAVSPWLITESQQRALDLQQIDGVLSTYFTAQSVVPDNRQQWLVYRRLLNEAHTLGFTQSADVYAFLSLCGQYSFLREPNQTNHDNFRTVHVTVKKDQREDIEQKRTDDLTQPITAHLEATKTFQILSTQDKLKHIERLLEKDKEYVNK